MVLKRKENCKLIYINNKYYVETSGRIYHFNDNLREATECYKNIKEVEKRGIVRFFQGKFIVELYPAELNDILKSIEYYKYFSENCLRFKCDFKSISEKSYDLDFLYRYLFCIYRDYLQETKESGRIENIYNQDTIS